MTYNTNNIFQLINRKKYIAKNIFFFSVISFLFLAITIGLASFSQKALAQTQQKITNKDVFCNRAHKNTIAQIYIIYNHRRSWF